MERGGRKRDPSQKVLGKKETQKKGAEKKRSTGAHGGRKPFRGGQSGGAAEAGESSDLWPRNQRKREGCLEERPPGGGTALKFLYEGKRIRRRVERSLTDLRPGFLETAGAENRKWGAGEKPNILLLNDLYHRSEGAEKEGTELEGGGGCKNPGRRSHFEEISSALVAKRRREVPYLAQKKEA